MKRKQNEEINRGDIYWCCPKGSPYGKRLYVVVSNDAACRHSEVILMCPLTSQSKRKIPTHITLYNINNRNATLMCENIVLINKTDIMDYVMSLGSRDLQRINTALFIALGL